MDDPSITKMEELDYFCESDELSLTVLREKISQLSISNDVTQDAYNKSPFLHAICLNKNVTLEMVKLILDSFPGVATWKTDAFDFNSINTTSYAIHCACHNEHCPGSVIELLLKEYPLALEHLSRVIDGVHEWNIKGLPLHYYLARKSNIDIDTVKLLVETYPQSLMSADETWQRYPIHAAVYDSNPDDLHKVIEYMLEINPASLRVLDGNGSTLLHLACGNERMNLDVFKLLVNSWPEAMRMTGSNNNFPLHELCRSRNRNAEDSADITILRFMLDIDQTVVRERNGDGELPIHYAVKGNSFEFCKVLIDAYPESIRVRNDLGKFPIHEACGRGNGNRIDTVDTIQYMLELDPDLINAGRSLPIHHAAVGGVRIIELLLKHDPDAASKVIDNQSRQLPLHIACGCYKEQLDVVKTLYDAFPQAIHVRNKNGEGQVPLEYARKRRFTSIVRFLETQNVYAQKAKDTTSMHTLDKNGWLPLHHALKDKVPLGSIKLLVEGNPSAVRVPDDNLAFPLHIACQFSTVKVVRYLVELVSRIPVSHLDTNKDSVLHYACRGGNLGVVKYLITNHSSLVASAEVNEVGQLPLHLLCEAGKDKVDCDSAAEYVETVWLMLVSNPEALLGA